MKTTTAAKKFALATLAAPVLAALATGLAGTTAASPAGPHSSDIGTNATVDANTHGGAGAEATARQLERGTSSGLTSIKFNGQHPVEWWTAGRR